MSVAWHRSPDPAGEVAKALHGLLEGCRKEPVLLLVSGGSWFGVLNQVPQSSMDNLTLTVLDERYSTDPSINNFAQLTETSFFTHALERGAQIIDMRVRNGEEHRTHAARMQAELWSWKQMYPQGVVIAAMGIGDDGHTAGILSQGMHESTFLGLFDATDQLVVAYRAGKENNPEPNRTTTTFRFLHDCVDYALVYAAGANKCAVLEKLQRKDQTLKEMPATIIFSMKKVDIYTDCS